jgi:hypothetical protein
MRPRDFIGRKRGEMAARAEPSLAFRVPNAFRDDPKFFRWRELIELRSRPEMMGQVDGDRRVLAARLGERATTDQFDRELRTSGSVALKDGLGQPMALRASGLLGYDPTIRWWLIEPMSSRGGPFEVDTTLEGGRVTRQRAQRALMRTTVRPEDPDRPISLILKLEEVSTLASSGESSGSGVLRQREMTGVTLANDPTDDILSHGSRELVAAADSRLAKADDEYIRTSRDALVRRLDDLAREVVSKEQERLALSMACLVMVVTGAIMAMRLREQLPLTVYLWSFFPALTGVLTVSAGQELTHQRGVLGLALLWGGVIALCVYTIAQYFQLRKH